MRDCLEARKVWNHFIPLDVSTDFFSCPLQSWIGWNLSKGRMKKLTQWWDTCFAVICSWIWRWRNEAIFDGAKLDEPLKIEHFNRSITEMIEAYHKLKMVNGHFGKYREMCGGGGWEKPIAMAIKVNIDGS